MADVQVAEVGARNSRADLALIQEMHDRAVSLGAVCKHAEPDADDMGAMESVANAGEGLALIESAFATEPIVLREARADYPIKLIAPGKGSSAYYPKDVLERDGPKVFKAGTHVYLNHPTEAEEAARPEGDVANLAGVLTSDAAYQEAGSKGPGLYARMKVFADHAQMVEEKAPHVGMSIRANGNAMMEAGRPVLREGVPVLRELTSAESVDVVTRAGAGGMILQEAARAAETTTTQQEESMDASAFEKLQEQIRVNEATNARLLERAIRMDAREEGAKLLEVVSLPPAAKLRVIETCLTNLPTKDGELDRLKFSEAINAAAKSEGQYIAQITGSGRVMGMGPGVTFESDPAKLREAKQREAEEDKRFEESAAKIFGDLTGNAEAGKLAARGW